MILIAGIPEDGPTALVIEALDAMGASYRLFDQRSAAVTTISIDIADDGGGGAIGGMLTIDGETVGLEDVSAAYLRLMDHNLLPDLASLAPDAPARRRCGRVHELLLRFGDIAPGRILNRPTAMSSNHSKPFQAHAIRSAGFDLPETLITNDPFVAREFVTAVWAEDGGVVYKSISGIRSIVQRFEEKDLARLDRIRWCPTQFQRQVMGTDLRVHVVGGTTLAAAITSDATDYRYAARQTQREAVIAGIELDRATSDRCIRLAQQLDLPLAGIDLRRTAEGRDVCFEVNPSPAFSFYEHHTGLPIGAAVARYLAGEAD